jgi:hypothetical protein
MKVQKKTNFNVYTKSCLYIKDKKNIYIYIYIYILFMFFIYKNSAKLWRTSRFILRIKFITLTKYEKKYCI